MKSYILLGYRNLSRRRSRSILTVLGVILAIGFTVGLLSISEGFTRSFNDILTGSGPDLFLRPKGGGRMSFRMQSMTFLDAKLEGIVRGIPGVRYVEPVYETFAFNSDSSGFESRMTMVSGMRAKDFFKLMPPTRLVSGRFFKDGDGNVAVLGAILAENSKMQVGQEIDLISGQHLKIIGILAKTDEPFDLIAYAPIEAVQKISHDPGRVNYFLIKADDSAGAGKVSALLKRAFPQLDVQTVADMVRGAEKMLRMARAAHIAVSSFALLIGVLFVACTMIMSVSERIREFATLRVIGASKGFVVKMILSESLILSAFGGFAGCVFGYILSKAIDAVVFRVVGETLHRTFVSPRIFLTGFLIALLIGAFAGFFPGRMILRRNLAESLRYE